jgi:hypothetical protein
VRLPGALDGRLAREQASAPWGVQNGPCSHGLNADSPASLPPPHRRPTPHPTPPHPTPPHPTPSLPSPALVHTEKMNTASSGNIKWRPQGERCVKSNGMNPAGIPGRRCVRARPAASRTHVRTAALSGSLAGALPVVSRRPAGRAGGVRWGEGGRRGRVRLQGGGLSAMSRRRRPRAPQSMAASQGTGRIGIHGAGPPGGARQRRGAHVGACIYELREVDRDRAWGSR